METANPLGVAVIMAMQKLLPVGSIIEWCPVSGGPDLSTPAKVAAYYGFGQWEAFGAGRSTVGADNGHAAGATWGEASHTLTEGELPKLSGQIGSGEGSLSGGSGSSGVFRLGGTGIVNTDGVGAVFSAPQMVGIESRIFGRAVNIEFGGGQAHNNWQPSVAVYRYRRIA